jgi:hypothetical protein
MAGTRYAAADKSLRRSEHSQISKYILSPDLATAVMKERNKIVISFATALCESHIYVM